MNTTKTNKKRIITSLILLSVVLASGVFICWSRTEVSVCPSPTGEYSIRMHWIDVGGWGWQGRIYLVKHGILNTKYWTGLSVPASCKWLSDHEFEIDGGSWPTEKHKFNVYDFIRQPPV